MCKPDVGQSWKFLKIYLNKIGMVRVLVANGIYSVLWGVYYKIETLRINVPKLDA